MVIVGHGLVERQVLGPVTASGVPEHLVLSVVAKMEGVPSTKIEGRAAS